MLKKLALAATVSLSALLPGLSALAAPIPIEALAREPALSSVSMSDEGDLLIGLVGQPGKEKELLAVAVWELPEDLSTVRRLTPTRITPSNGKMRFVGATALKQGKVFVVGSQAWTGQTQCLEGGGNGSVKTFVRKVYIGSRTIDDLEEGFAGIGRERLRDKSLEQCRDLNNLVGVANSLPSDPENVIINYNNIASGDTEYYKVNLRTEKKEPVVLREGPGGPGLLDPRTNEVLTRSKLETRDGNFVVETYIWNTAENRFDHEPVLDDNVKERFDIAVLGRNDETGEYFVRTDKFSDKKTIYSYDPKTDSFSKEPVFAHPDFDALDVVQSRRTGRVLGFSYYADVPRTYWIDPTWRSIQEGLEQAYPEQIVELGTATEDLNRILFTTSSSAQPPVYHLLVDKARVITIGASRPWIDTGALRKTELVYYPARDGLQVPGFLTLPKDWTKEKGPIPTVVLPHGGPWVRDDAGWDPTGWIQFLATRGYAVLQPQYRGSTFFGRKLWVAGDAEWGQKMQDDKDDGARWLVEQGIADADKIAIFGYSYGGFAAFAATVRPDGPFSCAIAGAGVANLALFNRLVSDNRISRARQGWTIAGMDPLQNAARAVLPILIYHGDRDVRVPIGEGSSFYNAVKGRVNAKFVQIKDMPHSLPWWPEHHEKSLKAIEEFLAGPDCFGTQTAQADTARKAR